VGLAGATDDFVREYAATNGFIIVTRDLDFPELVKFSKPPPKVIWLEFHNPSTRIVANALRINLEQIEAFAAERETSLLVIRQNHF
jgi:predicted nuclease of predicted toxin-antitoxin system